MTKFTFALLALATLTFATPVWAQETYSSRNQEGTKVNENSKPVKQVYRGPLLSTALPTAGPYANGISIASSFPRQPVRRQFEGTLGSQSRSRRPTVDLSFGRTSSLYRVDSSSIARAAVYRTLFSGLGGDATTF